MDNSEFHSEDTDYRIVREDCMHFLKSVRNLEKIRNRMKKEKSAQGDPKDLEHNTLV